jgi:hypothetical protein
MCIIAIQDSASSAGRFDVFGNSEDVRKPKPYEKTGIEKMVWGAEGKCK